METLHHLDSKPEWIRGTLPWIANPRVLGEAKSLKAIQNLLGVLRRFWRSKPLIPGTHR